MYIYASRVVSKKLRPRKWMARAFPGETSFPLIVNL